MCVSFCMCFCVCFCLVICLFEYREVQVGLNMVGVCVFLNVKVFFVLKSVKVCV